MTMITKAPFNNYYWVYGGFEGQSLSSLHLLGIFNTEKETVEFIQNYKAVRKTLDKHGADNEMFPILWAFMFYGIEDGILEEQ